MDVTEILKLVWPIIIIQIGLQIYALIDLFKKKKTKDLPIGAWAVIVVLGGIIGPILYLLLGKEEE